MLHGLTDADYQRELSRARADGNEERVAVLQTTEEVVALLEFGHMHTVFGLKMAIAEAQRKADFLEKYLKSELGIK